MLIPLIVCITGVLAPEGVTIGETVGKMLGVLTTMTAGDKVGGKLIVGAIEGPVGLIVGSGVGAKVGRYVGLEDDGRTDGADVVGVKEGPLGVMVGAADGGILEGVTDG